MLNLCPVTVVKLAPLMSLYDLEITDWQELLPKEPLFRSRQIWRAIHEGAIRPEQLTSLPKQLRNTLSQTPELSPGLRLMRLSSDDHKLTEKALFQLEDKRVIETVLMHYPERSTVCVSSQAGCAMNCSFCATGQQGYFRQLTTGEIVEQVIWAISRTRATRGERRLSNVVFMGMGEPLANTRNLFRALARMNSDMGIGARHITVSTVGIVPGIQLFATLGSQFNLAVSLHAANNEKRSSLVPINRRYPIELLMETLDSYFRATRRRISFEWAMMDGVNDSDADAQELISLCVQLEAHVNLIPLNPTPGWPTKGTPKTRVDEFWKILENAGISATIRDNRGTGIDAACGQLAGTIVTRHSGERFYPDSSANIDVGDLLDY